MIATLETIETKVESQKQVVEISFHRKVKRRQGSMVV